MKKNICSRGGRLELNNGFTLIELLAVIVILAIIVLIATPIILNVIDSSRKQAVLRSGELYLEGVKEEIARKNLTSEFSPEKCEIQSDGNLLCDGEEIIIEASGQKPSKGTIVLEEGKITDVKDMVFGDYILETDEKGNLNIKEENSTEEDVACKVTYPTTTPNAPDVTGLTPVKYNGSAWVVTTSSDPEWYDYRNQKWANAVILNSGVNKNVGDTLTVPTSTSTATDVIAMLVWIPRYEYRIEGTEEKPGKCGESALLPGAIDIQFISKEKATADEHYRIHPAFTFDGEELAGIWVGKFETTGSSANPTVLPNMKALTNQDISQQFTTAQKFTVSGYDSHMAKNSEWGAVAYLSQSIYGKYGNPNYEGANKEVYKNDSGSLFAAGYTGRSSGKPSANGYSEDGTCTYDNMNLTTSATENLCGEGASTTGNITGVYDMNGGARDRVMGNYKDILDGDFGPSGFTKETMPASEYYDKYIMEDAKTACDGGVCYGHALSETSGWYGDYNGFVSSSAPWFIRGGCYDNMSNAGVFYFEADTGTIHGTVGFRVVLVAV